MTLSNPLIGSRSVAVDRGPVGEVARPTTVAASSDGTEWAVALVVLAALGVLVLFRIAGFQAVIAASVGK